MLLKFVGPRPFVLLFKEPEFFLKSVACDEQIEVSDQLGGAILAKYPGDFERVEAKRTRKVVQEMEVK